DAMRVYHVAVVRRVNEHARYERAGRCIAVEFRAYLEYRHLAPFAVYLPQHVAAAIVVVAAAATAVLHVVEQQCLVAGLAVEVEHEQPFGLGIGLAAALGAGGVDDAAGRVAQFRRGRTAVGGELRQRRAAEVGVLRVLGIAARGRDDFVGGRVGGARGIPG